MTNDELNALQNWAVTYDQLNALRSRVLGFETGLIDAGEMTESHGDLIAEMREEIVNAKPHALSQDAGIERVNEIAFHNLRRVTRRFWAAESKLQR